MECVACTEERVVFMNIWDADVLIIGNVFVIQHRSCGSKFGVPNMTLHRQSKRCLLVLAHLLLLLPRQTGLAGKAQLASAELQNTTACLQGPSIETLSAVADDPLTGSRQI